ncbi:hypothetical protein H5410_036229 [Solanum commersonii]|uniref:MADS-box domain-containing protein n=1 Tax=Solanum commersonii TaxID=4109 RepID=A0A9J5Y470_SOLCO|nr:hypothetical protein H5410_036229 [Solanum commersonii]
MTRNKVNYSLIEDDSKIKFSFNKRLKGLLKNCDELKTLCVVEVATAIYNPYRIEPYTFPNNYVIRNTFIKCKELPTLERSKNMVTREEFTMQRIKKLEEKLQKVRTENRVKEMKNVMYEVCERKTIFVDANPSYLNDLRCVIKKNLNQVYELMIKEADGEVLHRMSLKPLLNQSYSVGTTLKDQGILLLYSFHKCFLQWFHNWFLQCLKKMVVGKTPGLTHPMSSTIMDSLIPSPTMDSLIPSPMIDSLMASLIMAPSMYSLVSPTMTQQMEPSMDIPSIGISMSMNNNQNSFVDLPDSPTISRLLKCEDDVVMTLLDDPFFKNINVRDPNHTKKFDGPMSNLSKI